MKKNTNFQETAVEQHTWKSPPNGRTWTLIFLYSQKEIQMEPELSCKA